LPSRPKIVKGYLPEEARDDAKAIKAAIEGFISDMTFELQQEPSVGNLAGTQIQHGARIIAIRPSGYRKSRQVLSSVKAIKRCG
jgi:peptide deformylase